MVVRGGLLGLGEQEAGDDEGVQHRRAGLGVEVLVDLPYGPLIEVHRIVRHPDVSRSQRPDALSVRRVTGLVRVGAQQGVALKLHRQAMQLGKVGQETIRLGIVEGQPWGCPLRGRLLGKGLGYRGCRPLRARLGSHLQEGGL